MNRLIALTTDNFNASIGAVSSPAALRRHLIRCAEVQEIRKALADGHITEKTIEGFTQLLMNHFVRGEQFRHEAALAALAVVLENRHTEFAEDYLLDLARLKDKISELDLAPRIAGLCLQERQKSAAVIRKQISSASRVRFAQPAKISMRLIVSSSRQHVVSIRFLKLSK